MNKLSLLACDWTWAGEKIQPALLYPSELRSNENNRARKKARALMIAFGLGVETVKIMRKKEEESLVLRERARRFVLELILRFHLLLLMHLMAWPQVISLYLPSYQPTHSLRSRGRSLLASPMARLQNKRCCWVLQLDLQSAHRKPTFI